MNHWVLGKRGVAPVKNPKGKKRKPRRNPGLLSANDRKVIRAWAKKMRKRKNPSLDKLPPSFAKSLLEGEGLRIAPTAREIEESKRLSKKELRRRAARVQMPGRGRMTKEQLRQGLLGSEDWDAPEYEWERKLYREWMDRPALKKKKRSAAKRKPAKKRKAAKRKSKKLSIAAKNKKLSKTALIRKTKRYGINPNRVDGKQKKKSYLLGEVNRAEKGKTRFGMAGYPRKNPSSWWNRLLPGRSGASEDKVLRNPEGSDNMARASFAKGKRYSGHLARYLPGGRGLRKGARARRISMEFKNPRRKKRRKHRRKKNPSLQAPNEWLGGLSFEDIGYVGLSLTGLCAIENLAQRHGWIDFSGYGRYMSSALKLAVGLAGAWGLEKAGALNRGSKWDRLFKLSAVAAALTDLSKGFCDSIVSPAADAAMEALGLGYAVGPGDYMYGLGETVANPASQGSVVLDSAAGLGYAVGPGDYILGETVANPASQGAVALTNALGELSYNPHSGLGGLAGGFYAGQVSLPKGAGEHPDFMNQVPGRSDLSAVPDFMR